MDSERAASESPAKRARPKGLHARVSSLKLPTLTKICSLAVDTDNTIFVGTESALYTISPAGGRLALLAGSENERGFKDGQGSQARFNIPRDLAIEGDGSLLVADTYNHCLRRVSPHGTVTTLAGSGEAGFADGVGSSAQFHRPRGVVVDRYGIIFVSDHVNHCIRRVTREGEVSTLCGSRSGEAGFVNGGAGEARFYFPCGLALDVDSNLLVADYGNHCIRKCHIAPVSLQGETVVPCPAATRVTTVAGSHMGGENARGYADGPGSAARFHNPSAVAVDGNNSILVADRENHKLRMIKGELACVSTLAGTCEGMADGEGISARFDEPWSLAVNQNGQVLVAELGNAGLLRIVDAALAPMTRAAIELPVIDTLKDDLGALLADGTLADVSFAVDGRRFEAHRCVLAARSPYFKAMFDSGRGMREGGSGADIVFEDLSADSFQVLLRYLYAHELPTGGAIEDGDRLCGLVRMADRFQATALCEYCINKFNGGLAVGNVIERIVQAHDSGLSDIMDECVGFFKAHALDFQREAMQTFSILRMRPDLIDVAVDLMTAFGAALGGGDGGHALGPAARFMNPFH